MPTKNALNQVQGNPFWWHRTGSALVLLEGPPFQVGELEGGQPVDCYWQGNTNVSTSCSIAWHWNSMTIH